MKICIGIVLAIVVAAVGIGFYVVNINKGNVIADAPRREQADIDTSAIPDEPVPLASNIDPALSSAARSAFDLMNQQRAAAGLSQLTWSDQLANCAAVRAQEASVTWAHTRPNGTDWYTVNSAIMGGENLARGYQTAQDAVNAWMASATHKDNILYPSFRVAGIAIYNLGGYWYWSEEFGY